MKTSTLPLSGATATKYLNIAHFNSFNQSGQVLSLFHHLHHVWCHDWNPNKSNTNSNYRDFRSACLPVLCLSNTVLLTVNLQCFERIKKKKRLATQVAKASLEHRTKEYYHHKLHEVILTCETQHGSHMSPCVRGEQSAPFFLHEMGLVTSFLMPPSQSELTRCASFLPKRPPRHEKAPIGQLLVGLSCRVALLSASATGCVSPPPPPPTAGCCSQSLHPPPAYLHTRRWRWWWWWWWWRWWWWRCLLQTAVEPNAAVLSRVFNSRFGWDAVV